MIFLRLFYEFFKAGLFAIGGGLATLPFLTEMADKTGWFTQADLADMIAISESTPGPIGVNMASYVGFTTGGTTGVPGASILGCVVATLGLITPSIIIILIVFSILKKFKDNPYVKSAFYGLRPASTGLIAAAGFSVVEIALLRLDLFSEQGWGAIFDWKAILLAVILYLAMKFLPKINKKLDFHPALYLLISAVIGILFQF
jgi:chromate transporter